VLNKRKGLDVKENYTVEDYRKGRYWIARMSSLRGKEAVFEFGL
jgi:hypothetical protein